MKEKIPKWIRKLILDRGKRTYKANLFRSSIKGGVVEMRMFR